MRVNFQLKNNVLDIKLEGEIDHHTCVQIREKIDREYQRKRAKHMMLDFEHVRFMDSSGIGLLMGRYKNVSIVGGSIAVYNVPSQMNKMLSLAGLYKLIKLYDNREKALSDLK